MVAIAPVCSVVCSRAEMNEPRRPVGAEGAEGAAECTAETTDCAETMPLKWALITDEATAAMENSAPFRPVTAAAKGERPARAAMAELARTTMPATYPIVRIMN